MLDDEHEAWLEDARIAETPTLKSIVERMSKRYRTILDQTVLEKYWLCADEDYGLLEEAQIVTH